MRETVQPAVLIGCGATIDFLAGVVPRAPTWISHAGLEWLYRLAKEPRRLWRRYLLRDPEFALVVLRQLRGGLKQEHRMSLVARARASLAENKELPLGEVLEKAVTNGAALLSAPLYLRHCTQRRPARAHARQARSSRTSARSRSATTSR